MWVRQQERCPTFTVEKGADPRRRIYSAEGGTLTTLKRRTDRPFIPSNRHTCNPHSDGISSPGPRNGPMEYPVAITVDIHVA